MRQILQIVLLIMMSVLIVSCRDSGEVAEFEVFKGGGNINLVDLKKESLKQLSYEIQLPYPDTRILDFYSEKLGSQGWVKCEPHKNWNKQIRKDGKQFIGIQQLVRYFMNSKGDKLLMLVLQYFSEPVGQLASELEWKYDTQHVTLAIYHLKNRNQVLDYLSLDCSKVPGSDL